jgi:hypothetical protein
LTIGSKARRAPSARSRRRFAQAARGRRRTQQLDGVGNYTGAQALLQLLHGVFRGDAAKCFTPTFELASMRDWCAYGPGPETSCEQIFNVPKKQTLAAIRWLQVHQKEQFERLGLKFPYLLDADGQPRLLAATDFEHSLCYFSRYLNTRDEKKGLGVAAAEVLCGEWPDGLKRFTIGQLSTFSSEKQVREKVRPVQRGRDTGAPQGGWQASARWQRAAAGAVNR